MATTAHGRDEEEVRALGASEVIDYTKVDFAELVSRYDVVLDSLGGDNLTKSLTVLKAGGPRQGRRGHATLEHMTTEAGILGPRSTAKDRYSEKAVPAKH